MKTFTHYGNREFVFGNGTLTDLPHYVSGGGPLFVLTGKHFLKTEAWEKLTDSLKIAGIAYGNGIVSGEPSPDLVDELTAQARQLGVRSVAAIGGGSVMDAAKAAAAMLCHEGKTIDYMEGVGSKKPTGQTVPLIAVPTTAGTGSESTKNAVLSRRGRNGFKRSLRHSAFMPQTAILDPSLALDCPPDITLSCGMDALCQLLESFVAANATPVTDALAKQGLMHFRRGMTLFSDKAIDRGKELELRGEMALAAWMSGAALTNADVGAVHGIAGPLGAVCNVPHGTACGLLIPPVFRCLVGKLGNDDTARETRQRLEIAGTILFDSAKVEVLLERIEHWTAALPRLSTFGLEKTALDGVAAASGNKGFPVSLEKDERRVCIMEVF